MRTEQKMATRLVEAATKFYAATVLITIALAYGLAVVGETLSPTEAQYGGWGIALLTLVVTGGFLPRPRRYHEIRY